MSAPSLHRSFRGAALFKSANGSRTSMASGTSIVKKAQKAAKSAARKVGYKKFDGAARSWKHAEVNTHQGFDCLALWAVQMLALPLQ